MILICKDFSFDIRDYSNEGRIEGSKNDFGRVGFFYHLLDVVA
jgi:hypothetical protein